MVEQDAGSATDNVDEPREGAGAAQPDAASFAGMQCSRFTARYGVCPDCMTGMLSLSQRLMLKWHAHNAHDSHGSKTVARLPGARLWVCLYTAWVDS